MAAPRPPAQRDVPDLYVDMGVDEAAHPPPTGRDPDLDSEIDLDLDAEIELEADLVIDLTQPLRHRPELVESGAFTRARCQACGWSGPARRARAVAQADAKRHEPSS